MLDLNELERRLDEALANETEASLNEWLLNQRRNEFSNYLGMGYFENKEDISFSYPQKAEEFRPSVNTNLHRVAPCINLFYQAA